MARLLSFPNPVNELAARSVAAGVALVATATIVLSATVSTSWLWLSALIAYGFVARVASGPTLSPLGQLATRLIAPRLGQARLVPGPPKRFAQAVGAGFSITATVLYAGFGQAGAAQVMLGLIVAAATLESAFAICVGCLVFTRLMRAGLVPHQTCEACANISLRTTTAA